MTDKPEVKHDYANLLLERRGLFPGDVEQFSILYADGQTDGGFATKQAAQIIIDNLKTNPANDSDNMAKMRMIKRTITITVGEWEWA